MIIVLTPVKNEDWILEQFLTATSLFADCIIIADQNSSDGSRHICSRFPKVKMILNDNEYYNEAERQILLLDTARKLFSNDKRILFCLDADEIITYDSLSKSSLWNDIKNANLGTAIYFEKPDILPRLNTCVRWRKNYVPLVYVDDGYPHQPNKIHSRRAPFDPINGSRIYVDGIKFMHFAHTRINVQSAKCRLYSVVENVKQTSPLYLRRWNYQSYYDLKRKVSPENIEPTPLDWLSDYDRMNINFRDLKDPEYTWQDYEVMQLFNEFGCKRFYWENIWEFNWKECKMNALTKGLSNLANLKITNPPFLFKIIGTALDNLYYIFRFTKGYTSNLFKYFNKYY